MTRLSPRGRTGPEGGGSYRNKVIDRSRNEHGTSKRIAGKSDSLRQDLVFAGWLGIFPEALMSPLNDTLRRFPIIKDMAAAIANETIARTGFQPVPVRQQAVAEISRLAITQAGKSKGVLLCVPASSWPDPRKFSTWTFRLNSFLKRSRLPEQEWRSRF